MDTSNQQYSIPSIEDAWKKTGGNLRDMISLLKKKANDAFESELSSVAMPAPPPMTWVRTFPDLCKAAGVHASDYAMPDIFALSEREEAQYMMNLYWRRLMVGMLALNPKEWKPDIANVQQKKYCAYGFIIPDASSPFGFRLACDGSICDHSASNLGARPEFAESRFAIFHFENFTSDYEGYQYWQNKWKNQIP
jgi:hypothetical protein